METKNQQVNPQNKEIYCNTPAVVYLVNSGGYIIPIVSFDKKVISIIEL